MRQAYDYWQDQPGLSDATETHTAPWGHDAAWLSSKSAIVHISQWQHLTMKRRLASGTYNLTPGSCTQAQSERKRRSASHQLTHAEAVCHQAVAQYPESFDYHKETPWQAPRKELPLYPCSFHKRADAEARPAWERSSMSSKAERR